MKKQTGEILLLTGVLVVLAVVAFWQLRQSNAAKANLTPAPAATTPASVTTPASPATPAAAVTATPAAATTADGNSLVWVDQVKVASLVNQVKKGRNPFQGEGADNKPEGTPPPPKILKPLPGGKITSSGPMALPPLKEVKLTRTLEWVTPQELAQAFAGANLTGVKLLARKGSEQVVIVGLGQENFQKAVDLVNALDVPPPAPNFQLQGIVSTDEGRYVALRVDGKFYTLKEGSVVPNVGWVVTRVTPNRVTLVKEKQSVQLLLAGGHV
ncbi:MAG TPA: hypothetical protein VGM23_13470 [Armatimonadota bacterium]|jgi:hypothetical protein